MEEFRIRRDKIRLPHFYGAYRSIPDISSAHFIQNYINKYSRFIIEEWSMLQYDRMKRYYLDNYYK
jgi:hypothetical protein